MRTIIEISNMVILVGLAGWVSFAVTVLVMSEIKLRKQKREEAKREKIKSEGRHAEL